MAEAGDGRIVNVASSSGKRPSPRNAAYSVTKAAELSLSRVFADRWAGSGVLVNAVAPGPVATPLWLDEGGLADQSAEQAGITRDEALEQAAAKIPLGRMGADDEIAAVIVFLCSRQASNVTGAAWAVDGGRRPAHVLNLAGAGLKLSLQITKKSHGAPGPGHTVDVCGVSRRRRSLFAAPASAPSRAHCRTGSARRSTSSRIRHAPRASRLELMGRPIPLTSWCEQSGRGERDRGRVLPATGRRHAAR